MYPDPNVPLYKENPYISPIIHVGIYGWKKKIPVSLSPEFFSPPTTGPCTTWTSPFFQKHCTVVNTMQGEHDAEAMASRRSVCGVFGCCCFFFGEKSATKKPGGKTRHLFFLEHQKWGCRSWILGGIPQPEEFRPWILPPQVFSLPNPFIFLLGQFCIEKSGKVKEVERIINITAAASSSSSNHHFSSSKEFSGNKKMQKIP